MERLGDEPFDAIVIGSGFGGAMAAHGLVHAGERVLMLERGDWVARGPHNWTPEGARELTPTYSAETPYRVVAGGERPVIGAFQCVGGPSVYFGGACLRFRERDFEPAPEIVGDSRAAWPFGYAELEPYYARAESLLDVAGEPGCDPTEPPRSTPYPQPPAPLAQTSRMIARAARALGLRPCRIPLAINYRAAGARRACAACPTCDGFACAVEAKNDLATTVLPALLRRGLVLATNTVAVRLVAEGQRIVGVECFDKAAGRHVTHRARRYVLAAGTLASPHLLLASGLPRLNPGGHVVGRYLMRHRNSIVFGVFPRRPNAAMEFHKQLIVQDFYFGHPSVRAPLGKLGSIQQLSAPPAGIVRAMLPMRMGYVAAPVLPLLTGLLVIAEDQPCAENGVTIDRSTPDRFGLPQLVIMHRYTRRDRAAGRALARQAKRILRRAGAWATIVYEIRTFSHAVGTVRLGQDPATSALDADYRFRGVENLYVVDGSVMPTSAGVNPSLTIAANALRAAERMVRAERMAAAG